MAKSVETGEKTTSRDELRSNPYTRIDANAPGECGHLPVFSPRKSVFDCASERFAGLTTTGSTVTQGDTALSFIGALYLSTVGHMPMTCAPTELPRRPLRYILVSRPITAEPVFPFLFLFTPSQNFLSLMCDEFGLGHGSTADYCRSTAIRRRERTNPSKGF